MLMTEVQEEGFKDIKTLSHVYGVLRNICFDGETFAKDVLTRTSLLASFQFLINANQTLENDLLIDMVSTLENLAKCKLELAQQESVVKLAIIGLSIQADETIINGLKALFALT
jgi:hypothetical protein